MIDICEQVAESLSAFIIDGEVTGSQGIGLDRESIESHLRVCAYCSTLPANGRVPPPPERVWDGIESVLRAEGLIRD
ncbi:MAG: hypothetical protein ACAI25_12895 [Planctomycetota bacterium]